MEQAKLGSDELVSTSRKQPWNELVVMTSHSSGPLRTNEVRSSGNQIALPGRHGSY
jgi:hypothetical protein